LSNNLEQLIYTALQGEYELKNVGLVEFVASHSFNVSQFDTLISFMQYALMFL